MSKTIDLQGLQVTTEVIKSEIDKKQDKLIAGDGVRINNNIISCSTEGGDVYTVHFEDPAIDSGLFSGKSVPICIETPEEVYQAFSDGKSVIRRLYYLSSKSVENVIGISNANVILHGFFY